MDVEVDVFDALLGGDLPIMTPSGKVNIKLKEGTQNQKTLRLRGKGMPIYGKPGQFGDLLVTLNVKLPKKLSQKQRELLKQAKNAG